MQGFDKKKTMVLCFIEKLQELQLPVQIVGFLIEMAGQ
jgi:hypothetical protein